MNDEPKSAAELKEIRLKRKLAQDAEGIKAMADIAAADIAIRKRTANLRAMRLAKEAAEEAGVALKNQYQMLQVQVYDAATKTRSMIEWPAPV